MAGFYMFFGVEWKFLEVKENKAQVSVSQCYKLPLVSPISSADGNLRNNNARSGFVNRADKILAKQHSAALAAFGHGHHADKALNDVTTCDDT